MELTQVRKFVKLGKVQVAGVLGERLYNYTKKETQVLKTFCHQLLRQTLEAQVVRYTSDRQTVKPAKQAK